MIYIRLRKMLQFYFSSIADQHQCELSWSLSAHQKKWLACFSSSSLHLKGNLRKIQYTILCKIEETLALLHFHSHPPNVVECCGKDPWNPCTDGQIAETSRNTYILFHLCKFMCMCASVCVCVYLGTESWTSLTESDWAHALDNHCQIGILPIEWDMVCNQHRQHITST